MRHALAFLALALPHIALAGGPEPTVHESNEGEIVGTIVIPASESQVRAVVDDPVRCGKLSGEVRSIQVRAQDSADCTQLSTETRGLFSPISFESRRCPTKDGWTEQLVASEDFTAYAATWHMRAVEGGTEVTLRVESDVNLPIPDSLKKSHKRKSVGQVLRNLLTATRAQQ